MKDQRDLAILGANKKIVELESLLACAREFLFRRPNGDAAARLRFVNHDKGWELRTWDDLHGWSDPTPQATLKDGVAAGKAHVEASYTRKKETRP